MDDKDLFEQLARGPLTRNGFDESLRQKIHERIDNPKKRAPRFWNLRWGRVSAVFMVVVVVLLGVWTWREFPFGGVSELTKLSDPASVSTVQAYSMLTNEQYPRSAVLIGLRKDISVSKEGGNGSTYRTVLVVPQEKELVVAASGAGIWMPYKQSFWKIDAVQDGMGKGMQTIEAIPANNQQEFIQLKSSSSLRRSEKLLFAGNKFVSILQSTMVSEEGKNVNQSDVWVNKVENLAPLTRVAKMNILQDSHDTLSAALGIDLTGAEINEWAITREPGKWVAKQPSPSVSVSNTASITDLQEVGISLNSNVLSHDTLALTWDDINKVEPSAKDAFTSPTEDILAIVVEGGIDLYAYKLTQGHIKPLKLQTAPNETIIMVQWAVNSYIDSWKKQLSKWIPPTDPAGL
jgi:hypothetical protein